MPQTFLQFTISLLTLATSNLPVQSYRQTDKVWTKTSGGFQIQVFPAEMKAVRISNGRIVFSASALTRQGFNVYNETVKGENVGCCTYSRTFRPLSLVNTLLTFSDELLSSCDLEAHPSSSYRVTTIDLANADAVKYFSMPDDPLTFNGGQNRAIQQLTDIFKEEDVLRVLQQNSLLKQNLSSFPAHLSELPKAVDDNGLEVTGAFCRFTLSPDYLSRFTFHRLVGTNVGVRIELIPTGGACRNAKENLEILLPIPAYLRVSLNNASSRQIGFLAKDAPKGVKAQIQFSIDAGKANTKY